MPAILRINKDGSLVVMCPLGHLVESWSKKEMYGGSMISAELSFKHDGDRFDRLAAKCKGYGHRSDERSV